MKSKWLLLTKIQLMGMLDFNKSRYAKDAKLTRRTAGSFAIIAIIANEPAVRRVSFASFA